ncbi:MAG: hypothetical protein GTO12_22540 [Proteobacteria bacterium]|nr:hypothetical protein [Pseudomonadota bacterium]
MAVQKFTHLIDAAVETISRNEGYEICDLRNLSKELNADQLELIGRIEMVLVPTGGRFTMDATAALEVVKERKSK